MTDEWTFPTATGTATVRDGRLEISGSAGRMAREKWREGWTTNAAGRRALFVFSLVGSANLLRRVVASGSDILSGQADLMPLFLLTCVCFGLLAVAYRATRTKTARLRDIAAVRRTDDDQLTVEFEDESRDSLDIETPTESDADDAAEIFQLSGVPVGNATDRETSESPGFRQRLRAKVE